MGRIAGFDFLPTLPREHAPFYTNDCIWSWIIRRGQHFTPILFQENMVTNFDPALLCVSALITISFPLLSVVLFTDWVMAFFFLGNDPSQRFTSYLSTEHKLVGALSCHRMGCGTIVANRSLNLLFKCFPFDVTICLHQHRCDFSVSEP